MAIRGLVDGVLEEEPPEACQRKPSLCEAALVLRDAFGDHRRKVGLSVSARFHCGGECCGVTKYLIDHRPSRGLGLFGGLVRAKPATAVAGPTSGTAEVAEMLSAPGEMAHDAGAALRPRELHGPPAFGAAE